MASITDKTLLSAELEEEEEMEEKEFQKLLLQAYQKIQSSVPSSAEYMFIRPLPGFCLKIHTVSGEKVFVNVCRSPDIPPPADLSNEELSCLIESQAGSNFRIPMSLGEPHAEVDNSNNGCTAYDVTINTSFYNKMKGNGFLKEFFITIVLEGLSEKYSLNLTNQDWRILKNRKFMGSVSEQNIRTKSKLIIQEMENSETKEKGSNVLQSSVSESSATVPEYKVVAEPSLSHPDRLVAKICLPKMTSVKSLELDLGEDRIVLQGQPGLYHLDIFIPYSIVPEESKAQFHRETKILTVTMPVQRPLLLS
nr:PIH1 domain-containing protein 1 [Anolis sagrei ordinatus]